MLVRLRKRAQITLPKTIINKFESKDGDILDCVAHEGEILLLPQNKKVTEIPLSKHFTFSSAPHYIPDTGLYIQCFSRFCLYLDGTPVTLGEKAEELLAFLASEYGGPLNKGTAVSILWPDCRREQGLDNLLRLCKRIQNFPYNIPLNYNKKTVWLDMSRISCDLHEKVNTMSGKYSITIENKSANTFDFGVFQTGENANLSGAVIWLCKRCHPNTCVSFSWDTEYCFFWAEKGEMKQRKSSEYSAWGKEPADPSNQDKCIIGFTYTDGAYEFEQTSQKGTPGVLQIVQGGMIPAGKAVIGIGMSGNCIKCIRTQPNTTAEFELPVEYRVTFGSMNMGDPVNNVLMQQSVPLKFPPNVFGLTLTLNEDNTWSDPVSLCQHNAV